MKLPPKKKQVIRGSGGACGRTGRKLSLAPKRKQVVRDEDGEFWAPEGKKSDDADAGAKNQ